MEVATGVVVSPRTHPTAARAVALTIYLDSAELAELDAGTRARGLLEPGVELEPGMLGDVIEHQVVGTLRELLELGRRTLTREALERAGLLEVGSAHRGSHA
jgi:hypothetical protein